MEMYHVGFDKAGISHLRVKYVNRTLPNKEKTTVFVFMEPSSMKQRNRFTT